MLFKALFLVAVGLSTTECAPYPEPRASSVISGRVLRSSVEVAPITYQQSTQLLPATYFYSAFPTAPLAVTNPYQSLAYTTSPYYASPITAALPSPPPLSYSLTPSGYARSVTQQFVPAAAPATPATPVATSLASPGAAPAAYSYPVVYSSPYASIPAAARSLQAMTQAVGPSGQYLG